MSATSTAPAPTAVRDPSIRGTDAYALLLELPHFVMERKMLLEIKRRAERAA